MSIPQSCRRKLDHRVSALRAGPVMTRERDGRGIYLYIYISLPLPLYLSNSIQRSLSLNQTIFFPDAL
ncbi:MULTISPECIES: hypothetical protein, partial [unclassified Bradyrhizobium]